MVVSKDYDETRHMDLQAGSWRSYVFSQPPEVGHPTYKIVGPTERVGARDYIFSRIALDEGTEWYVDYYARYPERKEGDDRCRSRVRSVGERLLEKRPITEQMAISTFSRAWIFGRPDYFRHVARMKVMPTGLRANPKKAIPDPEQMTRKVKAFALYLGAGRVRIARLDKRWVYTRAPAPEYGKSYEEELPYPYVICMAFPQNLSYLRNHTSFGANLEVGWKYSYASFVSFALADYIKRLGWSARPSPTTNTPYLVPPLFIDCGIGEDGRCGYTLTNEFGNNWRPGGVMTDLPLVPDRPVDFGLQDFCDKCAICGEACPSGAIPSGGRSQVRGYLKWHPDAEKCYAYWTSVGRTCGICQVVCPWSHANSILHRAMREVVQRFPHLRKLLIKGEEIFSRRGPRPDPRWLGEKVDFVYGEGQQC
ncbi:MAG: 4Fe-4S dicluster domain-containing protein [Thermodesulfobacteriota bacterium]